MARTPALDLQTLTQEQMDSLAIDAEFAFLGSALYEPGQVVKAVADLSPAAFREPVHGVIWSVIKDLVERTGEANTVRICEQVGHHPAFQDLGGPSYLAELIDRAPPAANTPDYAGMIQRFWARRQLNVLAMEIQEAARDGQRDPGAIAEEVKAACDAIASEGGGLGGLPTAQHDGALALAIMEDELVHGKVRGVLTGLRCVDRRMGGLKPGRLVVIGGRPSMGKTALARVILYSGARKNRDRLFGMFSLEMPREEVAQRALAEQTFLEGDGVSYQDIGRNALHPEDRHALKRAVDALPMNIQVEDRASISLDDIRRRVWKWKRHGNLAAIVVDYLQLMRKPPAMGRNTTEIIGEITSGLKNLARDADICVILLSQLSRDVEKRDDKRPQLADLKDSGSIEQDADVVLFPYREHYYLERAEPKALKEKEAWEERVELTRRRLDVIAAKVRQGAVGVDRQEFYAEFDAIRDHVEDQHRPFDFSAVSVPSEKAGALI